MRVAVAGKGGAGKTTLSATLARLAARSGRRVVAVDADANPNLHTALGLPPEAAPPLPASLVSRRPDGPALTTPVDDVLAAHARPGPDGLLLVAMGGPAHAEEGCLCSAHAVVSALLEDLGGGDRMVIVDMEASPEHLSRGTVRHADVLWLVAEPYYRSLETVRRMAALASELPVPTVAVIGNKARSPQDASVMAEFCARHHLSYAGSVPWSDDVLAADQAREALVDRPGSAAVVEAVAALVDGLDGAVDGAIDATPSR